jgi:hypothetical protein
MQDVRSTVVDTMRNHGLDGYIGRAEPVITALVNRERDICGVLIEYATQQGLSRQNAAQALAQAGLAVPGGGPVGMAVQEAVDPAPQSFAPNDAPQDEIMAALRQMQETVGSLVQFARENGYRG